LFLWDLDMNSITTADLWKMQDAITGTVRHEVGLAREEFRTQIGELNAWRKDQDARADRHERNLARLEERTKGAPPAAAGSLSAKQKAALLSAAIAAVGVLVDGARHVVVLIVTLYAKGVRP
jgi:hypothetical protein